MNTPLPRFASRHACQAYLRAHGINVAQLAREKGFNRMTFVDLLTGRNQGLRGKSHQAAILLGLKDDPSRCPASRKAQS